MKTIALFVAGLAASGAFAGSAVAQEQADAAPTVDPEIAGAVAPLVESHMVLKGQVHGIAGDFRVTEFAGPCFSPDGKWLFVNAQKAGVTLAITGPWERGAA